ncbi:hypothetical protein CVIRNUC_008622 [Coccomyxa viridis]|uniref:Plant synaptotagmin n=1 Tax=Coccomyxa viridis TaxID=1274662 RepID=A0AAV1IHK1_9CHLO|nr:hypothetical protein CVIRNUC_008622 [Coccomyxa viridis]
MRRKLQWTWVLVALLYLCCLIQTVTSDGVFGKAGRLADEDIERIADRLGERSFWRKKTQGFHFSDFFVGIVSTACVLGFVYWRKDYSLFRSMSRKQKGDAIQALKDMDTETLRKILGDVNLPSWINFPDFERVNWANLVLNQMWPHVSSYIVAQAHPQLDPLLEQNRPSWMEDIKLTKFDLGETPPQVSGVKVYQPGGSQADEIIIEFDFMWSGQQDVEIVVHPIPRIVSNWLIGIGKLLSTLIALKVCMQRLIINGRIRMTLSPLLNEMPLVGAMKFSLVQMPDFSFDLDVLGGDVTLLPGLEAWLNSFLASSVLRPYVLPRGYTVEIVKGGGLEGPRGILFITLIEAQHLPKTDMLSKTDCYVRMGVRQTHRSRSQVINNDLNPKWNEDFKILVHEPEHQELRCVLYDYDALDKDDEIGEAKLAVADLRNQEEKDVWLNIEEMTPDGPSQHKGAIGKLTLLKDKASEGVHKMRSKMGRNKDIKCRLHLKVTYYEFHREEVDQAMEHHKKGQRSLSHVPSRVENKEAFNILMGGVLYVRPRKAHNLVKKNFFKGGFMHSTATVRVSIAGQSKKTAQVDGSNPTFSDVLEFILGADDISDAEEKYVRVEVWDYKLVKKFRGRVDVPLKRVLDKQNFNERVTDKFRLKEVDHGELELDLNWYSVLDQQPAQ